jgi:hypothetical protein
MHPLITNLAELKTSEIEAKINDLTKKYFSTHSYELQHQITLIMDTYKQELSIRRQQEWERMMENRNKNLDNLINVE